MSGNASSDFLLLAAMGEERAPFLAAADSSGPEQPGPTAVATATPLTIGESSGYILCTGIGPVNAAAALSGWLVAHPHTGPVVSVGSAGGLGEHVKVGDVVVGTQYRFGDVDARAFGYEFGQVPGMPSHYSGGHYSGGHNAGERALAPAGDHIHRGLIVTSSSFVGADAAAAIRAEMPLALAVDMETAALAQTCFLHGHENFVSVRGISDLCTPRAGEDFHDGLGLAARRSAELVLAMLGELG